MRIATLILCLSVVRVGSEDATGRSRDEAARMIAEYERLNLGQKRVDKARAEWFSNPRQALYDMAHSDDLVFPASFSVLLKEAAPIFAPHAIDLAQNEDDFHPLQVYSTLGFDRTSPEFGRRVIQKAIAACPSTEIPFAKVVVHLIELNGLVAELQDRPFFTRLANDPNQHESVRKAASAVVAEIDRKASATSGPASQLAGDPAKSLGKDDGKTASKASASESEWLWIIGAVLLVFGGGGVVWRLLASRK